MAANATRSPNNQVMPQSLRQYHPGEFRSLDMSRSRFSLSCVIWRTSFKKWDSPPRVSSISHGFSGKSIKSRIETVKLLQSSSLFNPAVTIFSFSVNSGLAAFSRSHFYSSTCARPHVGTRRSMRSFAGHAFARSTVGCVSPRHAGFHCGS